MKKLISVITLFTLLLTLASFSVQAEEVSLDPMNNVLFDVVTEVKDIEAFDGQDHGDILEAYVDTIYSSDGMSRTHYATAIYADGSRVTHVVEGSEFNSFVEYADEGFPAFLDKLEDNKLILVEEGYADNHTSTWYYLLEVTPAGVTQNLIATVESTTNPDTYDVTYVINLISKDENGNDVSVPMSETPMDTEEYFDIIFGEYVYNDGLIFKSRYDEDIELSGYFNIQGENVWPDFGLTYYGMNYNLGYFIEGSNTGGIIDWSEEDAEKKVMYDTTFTNSITNEKYYFDKTKIEYIDDNGYGVMEIKDDAFNSYLYVIKLKIPAIPTVHLNGEKICFDQIPVIEEGRTLVPLRAIFEALGAEVSWDGNTNTVTAIKEDTEIKLTIDSKDAYKNGELITLDVPAKLINGRTLVPVRFVADSFGVDVQWVQEELKVVLTK